MAADCVFCRILAGLITARRVYEDARCVALLDINPVAWGHALVIPREHHETWTDLPPDLAADLAKASRKVAEAVKRAAGAEGFNLLMNNHRCAGQAVFHAHFHVIPRKTGDAIDFRWAPKPYAPGEIERVEAAIKSAL